MEEIKSISGHDSLSSREVNRLKRKARMDARSSKKAEEEAENDPKKIKNNPHMTSRSSLVNSGRFCQNLARSVAFRPEWTLQKFGHVAFKVMGSRRSVPAEGLARQMDPEYSGITLIRQTISTCTSIAESAPAQAPQLRARAP